MWACYTLSRLKGIETPLPRLRRGDSLFSCYTLSRLKGIETIVVDGISSFIAAPCYTLSRLKGIETQCNAVGISMLVPCYTLSRLKGIETTHRKSRRHTADPSLLYTFPFEGN